LVLRHKKAATVTTPMRAPGPRGYRTVAAIIQWSWPFPPRFRAKSAMKQEKGHKKARIRIGAVSRSLIGIYSIQYHYQDCQAVFNKKL
jgi:hypothetical protein